MTETNPHRDQLVWTADRVDEALALRIAAVRRASEEAHMTPADIAAACRLPEADVVAIVNPQ